MRPVRAYYASLRPPARRVLQHIRRIIRAAAPGVTESISYGIPVFQLDDRPLLYCAAWTRHTSVYPLTRGMRRGRAAELTAYRTSKGTIQFPLNRPLPVRLLKALVKARLTEFRQKGR